MRRIFFSLTIVLAASLSCIRRDNPYDPLNYQPYNGQQAGAVLDSALTRLAAVAENARALGDLLDSLEARLRADSISAARVADTNAERSLVNGRRELRNDTIETRNDSTHLLDSLVPLQDLMPYAAYEFFTTDIDTASIPAALTIDRLRADSIIQAYNHAYSPVVVIDESTADSATAVFDSIAARYVSIMDLIGLRLDSTASHNATVEAWNDSVLCYNATVRSYNRFLPFKTYPVLTVADSVQRSFGTVAPGDTMVIGVGRYTFPLRVASAGSATDPIVVVGQPDMSTVFYGPEALLSAHTGITFRNLVFEAGDGPGFNIVNGSSQIRFINCEFTGNSSNGIDIVDSDVELTDCRIMGNHGSGIRVSSSADPSRTLTIGNVLIADNESHGIEVVTTILSLSRVTIAGNRGDGIYLHNPEDDLAAANCCIVNNRGYGLNYVSLFNGLRSAQLNATVISGNTKGASNASLPSSAVFLTDSISFADPASGDYSPAAGSFLDMLEQTGIVVGYRLP